MSFLTGVGNFSGGFIGLPTKIGSSEENGQKDDPTNHGEVDDSDVDLSCNPKAIMASSPPTRFDSPEEDDQSSRLPPSRNLEAENRRLLNTINANESLIQHLREEAHSTASISDNLALESDKLREQVATLSASLAASKSGTPPSPSSPGTHSSDTTASHTDDNSDHSRRASTPAPPSGQPSLPSRPLPTPNQRRESTRERQQSATSLQKALSRARSDLARRNTRVRQLEVAYEEKKQNDLQRQAKQDWALDKAERECEGLRREVRRLKEELAERIVGSHSGSSEKCSGVKKEPVDGSVFGSFDDEERGSSLLASPLLKRRRIQDPHDDDDADNRGSILPGVGLLGSAPTQSFRLDRMQVEDKLASTEEALAAAKKDISDKKWKIWRLEQQVEELEMAGFRNGRAMYEQKRTIQAVEQKLREGQSHDDMADSSLSGDEQVEDGYLYGLLGEAIITATEDETEERSIRSI